MALWNSHAFWNRRGKEGGFTWNSRYYLFVVRLNDTMRAVDGLSELSAKLLLQENKDGFYDVLVNSAFYGNINEEFNFEEDTKVSLLFALAEEIGLKDSFSDYIVSLALADDIKVLEEIKIVANLLVDDDMSFEDKTFIEVYQYLKEQYNMSDKMTYFTTLLLAEKFKIIDRNPKYAISDFILGSLDDLDRSLDWLIPFNMKVDVKNSDFQIMPPVQSTTIDLPNVDGSIVQNTLYKERLFTICMYSSDGLTVAEKEDVKRRITEILDSTKHGTKKLTIQSRGISFDVKYDDNDSAEGPSFVKDTVTFKSQPYGYDMFEQEKYGSGLILNEGVTPLRPKFTITGRVVNPSFRLGATTYRVDVTVPTGSKLVLDFEKYSAYTEDSFGNKVNVLAKMTGEFTSIAPGDSEALVADSNTESHIVTTWRNSVLW